MLNTPGKPSKDVYGGDPDFRDLGGVDEITLDFDRLFGIVRRQFKTIVLFSFFGLVLGTVYILTTQPRYTAFIQILIDSVDTGSAESSSLTDRFDSAKVDSQVVLIKSERISMAVIEELDLTNNATFMATTGSVLGSTINLAKWAFNPSNWFSTEIGLSSDLEAEKQRLALRRLQKNLTVSRAGLTYVLNLSFNSPNRNLAAKIANGFGNAYLVDQLEAKYDATRRASLWLQDRIQELRQKSLDTDLAVQKYKADNNLIAADGLLLGEQELAELNSELISARAATAQAEARYQRIRDIVDSGRMDAAVTEALNNPVIADLRSQLLEASKRYAEIERTLGKDHIQVVRKKNEMQEYERVIFDELVRISESYQSDYEISKSRVISLENSLNILVGESANTNETLVGLRELEREADTYKNLYQNFLQRYQEAIQQQSFPITEARIITWASPPENPSEPKKSIVLAVALVLGGVVGVGVAGIREFIDRGLRTGEQVRDRIGVEFLGLLPILGSDRIPTQRPASSNEQLVQRQIKVQDSRLRFTLDSPLTGYTETLRAAKLAADLMLGNKSCKIIGVVSAYPGEGKTTVSKNLASLIATLGSKTLLIDCDLRNPSLSRSIANSAKGCLVDVLLDQKNLAECLLVEKESSLFILPGAVNRKVTHTGELLASPAMKRLFVEAEQSFEYIVVDLPPITPIVDAKAMAAQVDGFFMVVEWGKTSRQVVRSALDSDARFREKCIGIALNKVDTEKQKLYEKYIGQSYETNFQNYYTN